MTRRSRGGSLARLTAGIATIGLVAGAAAVFLTAGSSSAATVTKSLNFTCPFPIVGNKTVAVQIQATLPDAATVGQPIKTTGFSTTATVDATTASALTIVGAATVSGTADASVVITTGSDVQTLDIPNLTIPTTPTPPSGQSLTTVASGTVPDVTPTVAGNAVLTVGNFNVTLTPLTSAGQPTGLGTFTLACTLDAGQDNTLTTIPVSPGTPPTTTTTAPPTTTTTVPPTTTTTTVPPTTTTTTVPPTTTTTTVPPTTTTTTVPPTTTTTVPPTTTTAPPTTTTTTTPPSGLNIAFNVNGTTHIKKLNTDLVLGPGKLATTIDLATGQFNGDLTLPEASGSFKLFGFLPATAKVQFIPVGKTTGTLQGTTVTSNSKVTIRLTDIRVFGVPLLMGADKCQTGKPATLALKSDNFSPVAGGTVSGTYTVPDFTGCGLVTPIINLTMAGPGNTVSLGLKPAAA
jgi:hypothetical protein